MRPRSEVTREEFVAYTAGMWVDRVLICEPPCDAYYRELDPDGGPHYLAIHERGSQGSLPGHPDRFFILGEDV